MTTPQQMIAEL